MDSIAKVIGGLVMIAAILFVVVILGPAIGALAGLLVGLIFTQTMYAGADLFGLSEPYQLGALLGFIGGFLRATTTQSKS